MPNPSNEYVCPRCLYSTTLKYRMVQHFEKLKKPCPNRTRTELTKEIKDYVLQNHVYVKPSDICHNVSNVSNVVTGSKCDRGLTLNQTVHNYNMINSLVSSIDSLEKIKMITDRRGIRQLDFEDRLEIEFQSRLEKMDQDEFVGGYCLNHDGLLKLVDGATKMEDEDLNKFNVLFDRTLNRVKILSCGKWDNFLEEMGVKEVVRLLKSYFLDNYELYLIKHLHGHDLKKNRFVIRNHLDIYYKFIGAFDLDAIVCSQTDQMILGYNLKENNDYYLAEHYGKIYRDLRNDIKIGEKNKLKRMVTNIIKENTTQNLTTLNKIMLDLVKTDKEFLEQLIAKKKLPMAFGSI